MAQLSFGQTQYFLQLVQDLFFGKTEIFSRIIQNKLRGETMSIGQIVVLGITLVLVVMTYLDDKKDKKTQTYTLIKKV